MSGRVIESAAPPINRPNDNSRRRSIVRKIPPRLFQGAASTLVVQPFQFRLSTRLCFDASLLLSRRAAQKLRQSTQCRLPIPVLASVRLGFDDDHAILGYPMIRQLPQAQLDAIRNGRTILHIKTQMDSGRDFVDILPARALRTNCRHANFGHWNSHIICNVESVHAASNV